MAGKRKLLDTPQPKARKKQKRETQSPKAPTKSNSATTFPSFLSLPPEIRQLILQHVVKSPEKIKVEYRKDRGLNDRTNAKYNLRRLHGADYATLTRSSFAIVLTSRQMYLEASNLYYSLNTFQCNAEGPDRLEIDEPSYFNPRRFYRRFLTSIGPTNTDSIAHLSLTYASRHMLLLLVELPANLKTLHLTLEDHGHYIPTSLEDYVKDKKEVAVTVEARICCSNWSYTLDHFARDFGLTRRDERTLGFMKRVILTRESQKGETAIGLAKGEDE